MVLLGTLVVSPGAVVLITSLFEQGAISAGLSSQGQYLHHELVREQISKDPAVQAERGGDVELLAELSGESVRSKLEGTARDQLSSSLITDTGAELTTVGASTSVSTMRSKEERKSSF